MLGFLLSLVNPLGQIARDIAKVKLAQADATTEQRKAELAAQIEQLKSREAVLIAEQRHALTRLIRPAFAYPPAFYFGKIWIWDKALGLGTTDPIDDRLWWIAMTIIGAYFLTRPFEKWRK